VILWAGCSSGPYSPESKSGNTTLANLVVSSGALNPTFNSSATRYAVDYNKVEYPFSVSVTTADTNATLYINDSLVASGAPFEIDTLKQSDKIRILVVAENGSTSQKYSVQCLPADFPPIAINVSDNPSPGYIFCANFKFGPPTIGGFGRYLLILDNNGVPVWYRRMLYSGLDFKVTGGILSYYEVTGPPEWPLQTGHYVTRGQDYSILNTYEIQGIYGNTDMHDFMILNNGHILLTSYYAVERDLSDVGGQPDARVIEFVIQELDQAKNVVFEWRSWEHFKVTDITEQHPINLRTLDYVHGNSIDTCDDGNIIISCRNMDEITKISCSTGEVMWRFGGRDSRNRQFQIIGDPLDGFSHQHCARWLGNNRLLLFDNGFYHDPPVSRALEYELNEDAMTATLVWSHQDNRQAARIMGSAQRLDNGNTVIGWGHNNHIITEVRPDGTTAFELQFLPDPDTDSLQWTYRGFRHEWNAEEW
jgi:hypothetical protein